MIGMTSQAKWDKRFLELADHIAGWSKDRSRGVGAVIVGPHREIRSTGYNGFPRLVVDSVEERHERPLKYKWTEHAERNALYHAARTGSSVNGCVLYSSLYPCADCARGIIQAGIKYVVTREPDWEGDRFAEDFKISQQMFMEAGVNTIFIDEDDVDDN